MNTGVCAEWKEGMKNAIIHATYQKPSMSKIVVIGSGIVGKATGKGFIAKGHDVVFMDTNATVLSALCAEGFNTCAPDALEQQQADAFLLTVSTPTMQGRIVLDHILHAAENLAKTALKEHKGFPLVVVRSTVIPGTTEEKIIPILEKFSGKKAGKDFGVCMNPEFLREKSAESDFLHPWIIVVGANDESSHAMLKILYGVVSCPYIALAIREAEMEKYVHNLFNACKIAFFNEIRNVCEQVGINADRVFNAVKYSAEGSWNVSYGTKDKGPFSGSCLPKDTQAFFYWTTNDLHMSMPVLSGEIEENELEKKERNEKFRKRLDNASS